MMFRCVAAACLAACGQVSNRPGGADGGMTIDSGPPAIAYRGTMAQTLPAMFGGAPYCDYTMTLKQLEIDLALLPSHQATSGHLQALNVEGPTTCANGVIPPTIANYTLSSSSAGPNGTILMFQGAADNAPMASLVGNLTLTGATYSVALTFHRTDQGPPLDWTLQTTVALTLQ